MSVKRAPKAQGFRYQVRITVDERDGPLWEWVGNQPERCRPREMIHLMRLGLAVQASLTAAAAGLIVPAPAAAATALSAAEQAKDQPEVTASKLNDFNVEAFDF